MNSIPSIENEPWFIGKDVAEILGYVNPNKALADHVDDENKLNNESLSSFGQRGNNSYQRIRSLRSSYLRNPIVINIIQPNKPPSFFLFLLDRISLIKTSFVRSVCFE